MLAISTIVEIGHISGYLAENALAKGKIFGGFLDPRLPKMIYCETAAVDYINQHDPTNPTLRQTANYLLSICGRFGLQAQGILSGSTGGSTISPINPSVGTYLIPITSANFTNATDYDNALIVGKQLEIFWNDIPRYLDPSEYAATATGISILIQGFNALTTNYTFKIYIVN